MLLSFQKFLRYLMLLLAAFSLLYLLWVSLSVAQCLAGIFILPFAIPAVDCEFTPFDFIPFIVALGYWLAGWMNWRERQPTLITVFFVWHLIHYGWILIRCKQHLFLWKTFLQRLIGSFAINLVLPFGVFEASVAFGRKDFGRFF